MKPETINRSGRAHAVTSLDMLEGANRAIEDAQKLIERIGLGRQQMSARREKLQSSDMRGGRSMNYPEASRPMKRSARGHAADSLDIFEGANRAIEDTKKLIEQITLQTMPWRDRAK